MGKEQTGKGKGETTTEAKREGLGMGKRGHSLQGEQNETKNPKISQCVYWLGGGKGEGVQNQRSFGSITIHQAVRTARDTLSHYTESAGGGGTAWGWGEMGRDNGGGTSGAGAS